MIPRSGGAPLAWPILGFIGSLVVLVPVAIILASVFQSSGGEWSHLAETRLPAYVGNTLVLAVSVCTFAGVIGVASAWLVTMHRFPGRRVLSWALLLPLAVPAYLAAYSLTDLLQFSGPVQTWLRARFDLAAGDYWFPSVRSLGGAIFILTLALYPYVYFAARIAFLEQSKSALESSRLLGRGPWGTFFFVALPLARPAVIGGLALVLMETVADFGAVDYCAVDTFATGIYRTWYGLESRVAASQLSALLISVLLLLILGEHLLRRSERYHRTSARCHRSEGTDLGAIKGTLAMIFCLLPVAFGFLFPMGRLIGLVVGRGAGAEWVPLGGLALRTTGIGILAAVVSVIIALLIGYAARIRPGAFTATSAGIARTGYAIPGPVVAIGLLLPLSWLDHRINDASLSVTDGAWRPGLIFTGSILALVLGYQTRFIAVGLSFVQSSLERVHLRIDEAARTLGSSRSGILMRIHIPLVRRSLLAAGLLVFVDVVKELPVTLMLRPFNFDTLAVRVYQLASDERLEEAATAALLIGIVGLLPVMLLSRQIDRIVFRSADSDQR